LDKYEFKIKLDELKKLAGEKKYTEAAELADSINWRKVRNINSLVLAGEVYTQVGHFEEARDVLLEAYDRSPIGRMIVYRLAEIAIKTKNFDEAQEYYDEFVEIAPHDHLKYVLSYEMLNAKGADLSEKIRVLEELKEQEYSEKWAFELAYLYHRAGEAEKCIDACDELVLWFGDGPYVEKALELKMLYQPLNKIQEQKYRDFRKKSGYVEVVPGEELESGEIVSAPVSIPDVTMKPNGFNTVNLQQELQKSMQQIMDATEKETVSDTMDNIKKMVEEIPYLQIEKEQKEEESTESRFGHIETDKEIDESINTSFREYLAEDTDGQMSLLVPEGKTRTPQITGQLSIDEILAEWEHTKRAAEAAMAEAEQRKLESAKARALQEAEDIMERLSDVIPQLNAGLTPKDLLEKEYLSQNDEQAASEMVANANTLLQREIDRISEDLKGELQPEEQSQSLLDKPELEEGNALKESDFVAASNEEKNIAQGETSSRNVEAVQEEAGKAQEQEKILSQATKRIPSLNPNGKIVEASKWVPRTLEEVLAENAAAAMPAQEHESKRVKPFIPPVVEKQSALQQAVSEPNAENVTMQHEPNEACAEKDATKQAPDELGTEKAEYSQTPNEPLAEQTAEEQISTDKFDEKEQETAKIEQVSIDISQIAEALKAAEALEEANKSAEETVPAYKKAPTEEEDLTSKGNFVKSEEPAKEKGYVKEEDFTSKLSPIKEETPAEKLNPYQKEVFTYFSDVKGMEKQIATTLSHVGSHLKSGVFDRYILIQSASGNGKTKLATDIVKVLQHEYKHPSAKVGIIDAASLNQKPIAALVEKIDGGALLIENAGELEQKTAETLEAQLAGGRHKLLVIMEGDKEALAKALGQNAHFAEKFTDHIVIPAFSNDELVHFAKTYANEMEYDIDEMGTLALYNRISEIQKLDEDTVLNEVKEIVDDAIANAEKISLFNLFSSKRGGKKGYAILKEKDFE
jgi:hypothetical protein